MSRLSIIVIALIVLALAAFGARLAWQAGWPHINQPAVTEGVLTSADRNDWESASSKVTIMLKKRFPVGTPVASVLLALQGQGFDSLRQCPDPTLHKVQGADASERYACAQNWDAEHALHYTWGRTPCAQEVVVWWTDDSRGQITNIEGQYACNTSED